MKLLIWIGITGMLISSCSVPSMKAYANNAIGAEYSSLVSAESKKSGSDYVNWWRKNNINKDYTLPNGNLVHVSPERKGCIVHWEIDKYTQKIIGYKFEGDRCY